MKIIWLINLLLIHSVCAQTAFNYSPINYGSAPVKNEVSELQSKLDSGKISLEYDAKYGYLKAVLAALDIPLSSQTLVFSKTSFQRDLISASNPRAIYFNEQTYIGWIPGSDVIEVMSNDPELGAIFYTVEQKKAGLGRFIRNDHDCLDCHSSTRTQSVPGGMLKSRYITKSGSLLSETVTHRTPLNKRWGSWYVTGNSGLNTHVGNLIEAGSPAALSKTNSLKNFFNTENYLSDSSDIIALMIMEHQVHMTNLITRASYKSRIILEKLELENPPLDEISLNAQNEILIHIKPLIRYMLFQNEAEIKSTITGNTQFKNIFETQGPKDKLGRSLRQLNLKSRLFEYPLSYMIYSANFQKLPRSAKSLVYAEIKRILKYGDTNYPHLTNEIRKSISQILNDTLEGF